MVGYLTLLEIFLFEVDYSIHTLMILICFE